MWLIWIDAYSKYGGAEQVSSANGFNTVRKLPEIFAMLGDLQQIVSDNGTPFTSRKFGKFCIKHGIRHSRSAPYHPATNGEADRFVQVFKRAIPASSSSNSDQTSASKFDTECEVHWFLQRYRTVPHSTIGCTPSELLFGRTIRTTLDLIRPQVQRQVLGSQLLSGRNHDRTVRERFFNEGQDVFVRQYLGPRKWAGGQVLRRSRPLSYDVKVGDQVYSRHASQLLQNRTGHQNLLDTQQEQLLDIHPSQKYSASQDAREPGVQIQISNKSTSEHMLHPQPQRSTQSSTSGSPSQPMFASLQKTQRASTSTRAQKAVVQPQSTRSLRARDTFKPAPKFPDEFCGLGSKKNK